MGTRTIADDTKREKGWIRKNKKEHREERGKTLNDILGFVDSLEQGDQKGSGLASSVFGPRQDVPASEGDGDALLLDW